MWTQPTMEPWEKDGKIPIIREIWKLPDHKSLLEDVATICLVKKKKKKRERGRDFHRIFERIAMNTEKNKQQGNPKEESSDVLSIIKDLFGYSLKYWRSDKDCQTIHVYINSFYYTSFKRIQ